MTRINSSRQTLSAKSRNGNYRPSGTIAQHVIDATLIDERITESVKLCRAYEPMLVGQAVVESGKQFFLVASKFEHRFYVAVYRNGGWQTSSRDSATAAMIASKAEEFRNGLLAATLESRRAMIEHNEKARAVEFRVREAYDKFYPEYRCFHGWAAYQDMRSHVRDLAMGVVCESYAEAEAYIASQQVQAVA